MIIYLCHHLFKKMIYFYCIFNDKIILKSVLFASDRTAAAQFGEGLTEEQVWHANDCLRGSILKKEPHVCFSKLNEQTPSGSAPVEAISKHIMESPDNRIVEFANHYDDQPWKRYEPFALSNQLKTK